MPKMTDLTKVTLQDQKTENGKRTLILEVTLPEEEYGSIEILVREKVLEKFEKEVKDCLIGYLQKKDDIWKKIRESFLKKESKPEKKQVKKKVKPEGLFS